MGKITIEVKDVLRDEIAKLEREIDSIYEDMAGASL